MADDRRVAARWGPVAVLLWGAAYGWPLAAVVARSARGVAGRSGLSLDAVVDVVTDARVGRLALLTLAQTSASVAVIALLGIPLGWVLARLEFPGRRALAAVVMVPFVLPTLTVAAAVLAVTGGLPASAPARFALIVAAHVCFNLGIMARAVSAAVASVTPSVEEAAATLGRRGWRTAAASLAAAREQILGAAVIVAMFCLTSFGVIVALGGASIGTIEVEVWYRSTRALDLAGATVLAGLQLVVVIALVTVHQRLRRPVNGPAVVRRRRPSAGWERVAATGAVVSVLVVCGVPLVMLLVRSLRDSSGWTLDHYRALVSGASGVGPPGARLAAGDAAAALGRSVAGAIVAALVALVLAVPMVVLAAGKGPFGRWAERAMLVPLATSAATLGLGFLLAFSGPAVDLRGTWILIPLVQAAAAAPVVARVLLGAARTFDRAALDAAATLGAGRTRRVVTVVIPALRRPFAVAAGFAVAMSVGEFGATVFLARPDAPTAPVLIGRLLSRPGESALGQALALSCVLGLIAALSVVVVDRSGRHTSVV